MSLSAAALSGLGCTMWASGLLRLVIYLSIKAMSWQEDLNKFVTAKSNARH